MPRFVLLLLALVALPFAAQAQGLPTVSGTAIFRGRMVPPPDAMLEVTIVDHTSTTEPQSILGSFRSSVTGSVPLPFAVPYDPGRVNPARRYVVRARLLQGAVAAYETASYEPVLTQGAPYRLDVLLTPVVRPPLPAGLQPLPASFAGTLPSGLFMQLSMREDGGFRARLVAFQPGPPAIYDRRGRWSLYNDGKVLALVSENGNRMLFGVAEDGALTMLDAKGKAIASLQPHALKRDATFIAMAPRAPAVRLTGTSWRLAEMVELGVPRSVHSDLRLRFDTTGAVLGSGGCSTLVGLYKATGDGLVIDLRALRRTPCTGSPDPDQGFMSAVPHVARFRIEHRTLEMLSADGQTLAFFRAQR